MSDKVAAVLGVGPGLGAATAWTLELDLRPSVETF